MFLVEGHCSKISSGYHKISLTVESCDMATNFVYTSTGLSLYTNRVIIDEFRVGSLITGGLYILWMHKLSKWMRRDRGRILCILESIAEITW